MDTVKIVKYAKVSTVRRLLKKKENYLRTLKNVQNATRLKLNRSLIKKVILMMVYKQFARIV